MAGDILQQLHECGAQLLRGNQGRKRAGRQVAHSQRPGRCKRFDYWCEGGRGQCIHLQSIKPPQSSLIGLIRCLIVIARVSTQHRIQKLTDKIRHIRKIILLR